MTMLRHFGLLALALLWTAPVSAQVSYEEDEGEMMDEADTTGTIQNCDDDDEICRIVRGDYDAENADSGLTCGNTPYGPSCSVSIPKGTSGFYLAEAVWHSATGNYEAAVTALDSALVLDPRSTLVRALLGNAQAKAGDVQGAMWTFRNALSIDDRDAEVYYQRALLKGQLGDTWGALTDVQQAIRLDSDDSRFHLLRAQALAIEGNFRTAHAAAERSIETSNDDCIDCYVTAGKIRFALNRPGDVQIGCRYLSQAGELGAEDAYDLIRQFCQ